MELICATLRGHSLGFGVKALGFRVHGVGF
jgi:hypothetical protein